MNLLGKIENGYLQLLRIIFLVVATLSLLIVVCLGIPAGLNFDAKPSAIPDASSINPSTFRLSADETAPDADSAATPAPQADKSEIDTLTDAFYGTIQSHGKKLLGAKYAPDRGFFAAQLLNGSQTRSSVQRL